ncbi:MAG TPA: hypothetical protein VKT28_21065 [Puia sp.]|nr:hypothetical protein [Puia sp.]
MKKVYPLIFLLFIAVTINAQELTGVWRGHFRSNNSFERMMGDDDRYKFEVQIAQNNKTFQAVTYSYKTTVFYGKAEAEGTFNATSKKVLLKELKIVEIRMATGDACIMTCFLQYSKLGDEEFLEGTYTSMNTRDSLSCGKGSIFLHKVTTSDFNKEPFLEKREKEIEREKHRIAVAPPPPVVKKTVPTKPVPKPNNTAANPKKPNNVANNAAPKRNPPKHNIPKPTPKPALAKTDIPKQNIAPAVVDSSHKIEKKIAPVLIAPKVLTSRQNELVKTITVNSNEIELRIYDDGTIDHDTVSVYVDNKNVINHAMLTDRPIIVKLHMDEDNDYHEVVMVAENEGEIPPNTSLMVVKAGGKEYEVRIVSTEQKNATVVFKFEKSK